MKSAGLDRFKAVGKVEFGEDAKSATGRPCEYGKMDRHRDVIFPGFFGPVLEDFKTFQANVLLGHWGHPLQIGVVTDIEEVANGLSASWEYHSTQTAQDAYTVAKERQAKGKPTGLSVGFRIKEYAEFPHGEALWKYIIEQGQWDKSLFDEAAIRECESLCWGLLSAKELYEFSQVTTGSVPGAFTDSIKSILQGEDPRAGFKLCDHLDAALAAVDGVTNRLQSVKDFREEEGRTVSADRLKQAEGLYEAMGTLIEAVKKGVREPSDAIDIKRLNLEAEALLLETQP